MRAHLTANAISPTQVNLAWEPSTDLGGGVVTGLRVRVRDARLPSLVGEDELCPLTEEELASIIDGELTPMPSGLLGTLRERVTRGS